MKLELNCESKKLQKSLKETTSRNETKSNLKTTKIRNKKKFKRNQKNFN